MVFSDPSFLFLFLPVTLLVYFAAPRGARNLVLTTASLVFYGLGEPYFLPILLASIALNYGIAIAIDNTRGTKWSKRILALGVVCDLSLLVVYKYTIFLVVLSFSPDFFHLNDIVLPLGISFFTFHKISYKVDVYRQEAVLRRNPLDLALYILLFPQLIAGPIIRYHDIADQISRRTITRDDFAIGVKRFIVGMAKKILIADVVAPCADAVFKANGHLLTYQAWLGVVCYALQIYFDFSGYSDMAIGLMRIFGFRILENFNYPYFSSSITDFWRRWHISLSRWFRDYLYIPLGGNRRGTRRTYANLLTVFFLCGLWHGASWTFVVWGLYHGTFLIVERTQIGRWPEEHLPISLRRLGTLLVVIVGWVLFRAESFGTALQMLRVMAGAGPSGALSLVEVTGPYFWIAMAIGLIASTPVAPRMYDWWRAHPKLHGRASLLAVRIAAHAFYGIIWLLTVLTMAASKYSPFLYYRF